MPRPPKEITERLGALKNAIEKEDYEKAARLRDEIRKLSPGN